MVGSGALVVWVAVLEVLVGSAEPTTRELLAVKDACVRWPNWLPSRFLDRFQAARESTHRG